MHVIKVKLNVESTSPRERWLAIINGEHHFVAGVVGKGLRLYSTMEVTTEGELKQYVTMDSLHYWINRRGVLHIK